MVVGVVAEFNPFHYGHKYQLDNIKADIKIALISPDFVQRGELSILNQRDKTKIALQMGYDIVLAIPTKYAIQNAEVFCTYASRILNEVGVDIQVFGAETENVEDIEKMIEILDNADIKEHTKKGISYNKACQLVMKNHKDLYKSNNILAMEYIRAIKKYGLNIKASIIKRKEAEHNTDNVSGLYTSASNIRKMINKKENIQDLIPYKNIYEYNINYEDKLYNLFSYIIKTKSIENIYDMNDEIINRMNKTVNISKTYKEFLENISGRNISINRIKRLILNVVLDIKKDDINIDEKIEKVKVLGINSKGAKFIKNKDIFCVDYVEMYMEDRKYKALYEYLVKEYKFNNLIYLKEV